MPAWERAPPTNAGDVRDNPTIIGLDIAKSSFQVHGIAASGSPKLRKRLSRGRILEFFANLPRCVIDLEACGGAHYWARELAKLGHEVRLSVRRIKIAMASACPYRTESQLAYLFLKRAAAF